MSILFLIGIAGSCQDHLLPWTSPFGDVCQNWNCNARTAITGRPLWLRKPIFRWNTWLCAAAFYLCKGFFYVPCTATQRWIILWFAGSWTVVRQPFCLMILDDEDICLRDGFSISNAADTPKPRSVSPWLWCSYCGTGGLITDMAARFSEWRKSPWNRAAGSRYAVMGWRQSVSTGRCVGACCTQPLAGF